MEHSTLASPGNPKGQQLKEKGVCVCTVCMLLYRKEKCLPLGSKTSWKSFSALINRFLGRDDDEEKASESGVHDPDGDVVVVVVASAAVAIVSHFTTTTVVKRNDAGRKTRNSCLFFILKQDAAADGDDDRLSHCLSSPTISKGLGRREDEKKKR